MLYQPDDGDAEHFVKTEVDPLFYRLPVLQQHKLANSKKYDTLVQKVFAGNIWHFLGANTPKNFRRLSVDIVILDELAGYLAEVGKDGDARALARTRITESPLGKLISQSSPLVIPGCQITAAYEEMDFRFQFYMPCPSCGHDHGPHQVLEFYEDGSKGVRWDMETTGLTNEQRAKTAVWRCEHCETDHSYRTMQDQQQYGQWRTEDQQHWLKDGYVCNAKGRRTERRWTIGFKSNCFISPAVSFEMFALEYLKAKKALDAGRVGPMKTLYQNRLGRAWVEDQSVTNIDYRTIRHKNAIEYPADGKIPAQILHVVSTCDVQGYGVEVLDVGVGEDEELFALNHTVIPGNTDIGEPWAALSEFWRDRTYMTEDGRELPILLHGIDHGGHWTEAVEDFCAEHGPREFLAIKGELGVDKPIAEFPRTPTRRGAWLVKNNTDTTKLTLFKRFAYERDEELWTNPGCMNFPLPTPGYENFDERFYKQATAESRIIRPNGKPEWKRNGRNEILDLLSMALCLIRVAQMPQYGAKLDSESAERIIKKRRKFRSRYDLASMGRDLATRS